MSPVQRPIVLGLIGDSAAGKTTLTRGLAQLLGPDRVTHVCTDDYHKYDRRERSQLGITALHPDCNYLDILELQLERLHYGQPILKPVYDHATGSLVRPEYIRPREIVIVEGLLGFHTPAMRQFYDIKVYLDPPEELRRVWKIRRDTTKRGYTADQVLKELEKREHDSREFIRPQRTNADIIVQFHPPCNVAAEDANGHLNVKLVLRPTIQHPDLSYLIEQAQNAGIRFVLGRDAGKPVDILEIDGSVTPGHARFLEKTIWGHLPGAEPIASTQFGLYQAESGEMKHSDPLALTQLLLTYHILREYDTGAKRLFAPPVAALGRVKTSGMSG